LENEIKRDERLHFLSRIENQTRESVGDDGVVMVVWPNTRSPTQRQPKSAEIDGPTSYRRSVGMARSKQPLKALTIGEDDRLFRSILKMTSPFRVTSSVDSIALNAPRASALVDSSLGEMCRPESDDGGLAVVPQLIECSSSSTRSGSVGDDIKGPRVVRHSD
jgi:hypothetical protein